LYGIHREYLHTGNLNVSQASPCLNLAICEGCCADENLRRAIFEGEKIAECPHGWSDQAPAEELAKLRADAPRSNAPRSTSPAGPGSMLSRLITLATGESPCAEKSPVDGLTCAEYAARMNDWGWLGCATVHRPEIVARLIAEAKARGKALTSDNAAGLLKACWREFRKKDMTE